MLGKLRNGQRLKAYPGADHNHFHDAARIVFGGDTGQTGTGASNPRRSAQTVLIRNDTGGDLERGRVVAFDGPVATPNDTVGPIINETPIIKGAEPTDDNLTPFAVLLEPIASNAVGLAAISGLAWATVDIQTDGDTRCGAEDASSVLTSAGVGSSIIWPTSGRTGETTCLIRIGGESASGSTVRRAVSTSGITEAPSADESARVTVQFKKPDPANPGEYIDDGSPMTVDVWSDIASTAATGVRCLVEQDADGDYVLKTYDCDGSEGGDSESGSVFELSTVDCDLTAVDTTNSKQLTFGTGVDTASITVDEANNKFVIGAAGTYRVGCNAIIYSTVQRVQAAIRVHVNGVAVGKEYGGSYVRNSGNSYDYWAMNLGGFPPIELAVDDEVEIFVEQRNGAPLYNGGSTISWGINADSEAWMERLA